MIQQFNMLLLIIIISLETADAGRQTRLASGLGHAIGGVNWHGSKADIDGSPVLVDTHTGTVRGKTRDWNSDAGGHHRKIDWFLGISYAEPPIGDLRFQAPEPVKTWQGVKNATRFGAVCPQTKDFGLEMKEDCLTLNIFSPAETDAKFPVLVFIHGGAYRVGTGASYMGNLLAQRGNVVVTINYRLGILGFLSGRNEHLKGNYGLLDQIEALRWIRTNIALFRGDPNKVTLYGHDAGATSVGILSVSPLAEGLFNQAILQSGSPLAFWTTHNNSMDLDNQVRQMAIGYNCSKTFFGSIVRCLKKVSEEHFDELPISADMEFLPVQDGHVIPRPLADMFTNGTVHVDKVMIGMVKEEWSNFGVSLVKTLIEKRGGQFDSRFRDGFDRGSFEQAVTHIVTRFGWDKSMSDTIIQQYTNWTHKLDPLENRNMYIKMIGDLAVVAPAVELANKLTVRNNVIPVYEYVFNHRSAADRNRAWKTTNIDLNYVFGGPFVNFNMVEGQHKEYSETSRDREMSEYMMSIWTDFTEFGIPDKSTKYSRASWTPFTGTNHDYLSIDFNNITMCHDYHPDGVAFWNKVIPGIQDSLFVDTKPWYHPTTLVWVLVAAGSVLLLTVLVLGVLLFVRSRRAEKSFTE